MKKKNILYIGYIIQYGHINFDRIHIEALRSTGNNVKLILHYQIAKELGYPLTDYELIIPKYLGIDTHNPLMNRFLYMVTLLFIKFNVHFENYDKIILSKMDELTLGLLPLCKKMYLICHDNAGDFRNKIKRYFMIKLSRNNFFIVFNDRMKQPFLQNKISNVFIVSHGCVPPHTSDNNKEISSVKLEPDNFVVFHPSIKIDKDFLNDIIHNKKFHQYLILNNVLFILRDKSLRIENCKNIKIIHDYLPHSQYQKLFNASDVVLLVYPDEFKYQVSGVSYECIANQKNILIRKNPSLEYCKAYYNYDPFFTTLEQLCEKIDYLHNNPTAKSIVSIESLQPNYDEIIDL
jgi:hypothetical protein